MIKRTVKNLLPASIRGQIPHVFAQRFEDDPMVYAKLSASRSRYTWLLTECDQHTGRCYGYVSNGEGSDGAWRFFWLSQGEEATIEIPTAPIPPRKGVTDYELIVVPGVERDRRFSGPERFSEAQAKYTQQQKKQEQW